MATVPTVTSSRRARHRPSARVFDEGSVTCCTPGGLGPCRRDSSWGMSDDVRREILGWDQFGAAGRELASTVVDDGYRPDLLLAIARGGLLIAGVMSYALGMKNCCVINVEYYTGVDERLDVPVILPPHLDVVDLSGAHLLIVDDVADTGETLAPRRRDRASAGAGAAHRGALREDALDREVRLRVAAHRRLDHVPVVDAAAGAGRGRRRVAAPPASTAPEVGASRESPEHFLRAAENSTATNRRSWSDGQERERPQEQARPAGRVAMATVMAFGVVAGIAAGIGECPGVVDVRRVDRRRPSPTSRPTGRRRCPTSTGSSTKRSRPTGSTRTRRATRRPTATTVARRRPRTRTWRATRSTAATATSSPTTSRACSRSCVTTSASSRSASCSPTSSATRCRPASATSRRPPSTWSSRPTASPAPGPSTWRAATTRTCTSRRTTSTPRWPVCSP